MPIFYLNTLSGKGKEGKMDISTEILQSRVSLIEKLLVNEKKEGDSINYAVVLSSRLVEINNKLNKIEANVPATSACVQIIADLKPYILQSRSILVQIYSFHYKSILT